MSRLFAWSYYLVVWVSVRVRQQKWIFCRYSSLKKHLDQGFGKEKQSSGTGRKEDGQEKEGTPTKKGSRQNAFISTKILLMNVHQNNLLRRVFLSAKSVKTDQWTDLQLLKLLSVINIVQLKQWNRLFSWILNFALSLGIFFVWPDCFLVRSGLTWQMTCL